LGTGTSQGVPVIGCDCEVCQSDNPKDQRLRTAALIEYEGKCIAIDCGPDFRQQMLRHKVHKLDAILLTHEHNDHVAGLDDVRPFNFKQKKDMPVWGLPRVCENVKARFPYIFVSQNKYPGAPMVQLQELRENEQVTIAGIEVQPIEVMHGRLPILGYRFGPVTYLTDVRRLDEQAKAAARFSETLIISALHRAPHYSHLNLEQALQLIEELAPKRAILTHVSHHMGLFADVQQELPAGVEMGYDGLTICEPWSL
jgi:phosphoribosyl 1,2-cyclic phosphate phosphodiesterase